MKATITLLTICVGFTSGTGVARADDEVDILEERAFKNAVTRVQGALVQIETIGGIDRLAGDVEGAAATTGVVVSADGEIVTSAFAFASKPSAILVRLADGRRLSATRVATDHVNQLALLRVDASDLTPPVAAPRSEIKVGQWSLAVGRTLDSKRPSVSVGIVSAVNRVWGKAIQTDAKVSPVNYGGALLDISGRVQGVLVPLSPRSDELMAGVEWYDSGIGFAIPMESVLASVERLRAGEDLKRGLLGVTFSSAAIYGTKPELDLLRYDSPAEKAGLQKGDVVLSVDGKPTERVAQVKHALGNKYAGDSLSLVVDRNGKEKSVDVVLVAKLPPWEPGFLGILPARSSREAEKGARVRFVVPDSPAASMGLAAGDVIVSLNGEAVADRDALAVAVGRIRPETEVEVGFVSGDEEKSAKGKLATLPVDTIVGLPDPVLVPAEEKVAVKTGRITETFETHAHDFWAYVPPAYNANESYGLVVWLQPAGDTMEARILDDWKSVCDARGLIMVAPKAGKAAWNPNEMGFVKDTIGLMQQRYSIDPRRVVVHGYGSSAGMSFATTLENRDLVRGVIVVGGGLRSRPPENRPEFALQIYLYAGEKDKAFPRVQATVKGLRAMKYPVTFADSVASGSEYPSADQVETFGRWIDSLDRI